jgi:IPT/TIG domain
MKITNLVCLALLLIGLSGLLAFPGAAEGQATGPELPRVLLDTHYVPPTGATINVGAGGNFQAALNAAQPGDTIVLEAGATYTTPPDGFVLPNKPGADWIVIKTSNMAGLPAEGNRLSPAAALLPRIVTNGLWPAVKTATAAHHYRFIGIEFTIAPALPQNYGIVTLGEGSSAQNSLAQVPHDIIIDRSYVHGSATVNLSRGIALNSARTAIIDSYVSDCHGIGYDTQAIACWNGPGPFKIVNNYLEGAAENVIFGGSPPSIANLIPSDIEFRRNTCYKPLSWKADDPSYAGMPWSVKNLFELKNAQRVLLDGNIFENIWVSGQSGFAIQWTPRGENGLTPWAVVQDITFSNNIVRHAAAAINLLGYDDNGPSQQSRRFRIANNLFEDIGGAQWGGNGRFLQLLDGTADVTIDHNTILHTAQVVIADGRPHTGFVYRNNLSRHNDYGVVGTGTSTGLNTLNVYFPGYVFAKNLLAGGPAQAYPSGNFFPASLNEVGFVDLNGGNYRLSASSPYKGAGTDGKDIGADIDAIQAAITGGAGSPPAVGDIVLYAAQAPVKVGAWQTASDPTAAAGACLLNPDAGLAKVNLPLASPVSYFEISFNAEAGRAYHLWMRSKAQNDSPYNDSVWVQFSDSTDGNGSASNRIGTTTATAMNLEDCSGCGLQGWGWQDNGWGVAVMGPHIYFQSAGLHTIRVQAREDGIAIDQIVLSPLTYLNASPGSLRNDNTILPATGGGGLPAPSVGAIAPNSGTTAGGTAITVAGTGFVTGASLLVGGTPASMVNVTNSNSLMALTPAHGAGIIDLVVVNPDGQSATLTNGFTFVTPAGETVLLADNFNDNSLNLSIWNAGNLFSGYTDAGLPVSETNQQIEIGPLPKNTTGSHYRGIRAASVYDFTGAYCYVALTQAPAANTAADAMLTIGQDVNSYYRIYVEAGTLICQKRINGAKTNLLVTTYNSITQRYWRIRHDAASGSVVFETAPDNSGVPGSWTEQYRESWNVTAIPLTGVQLELKAGTWQAEANQAGTVSFDNFKLAKP